MVAAVRERDAQRVIQFLRRRVKNLSQEALARMCGVAQSTITRAEAGKGLTDRRRSYEALQGLGALSSVVEKPSGLGGTSPAAADSSVWEEGLVQLPPVGLQGPSIRDPLWQKVADGSETEAIQAFRLVDQRLGGSQLYALVMHYLSSRVGPALLSEAGNPSTFIAAAGLTEMAGWMAHDTGRDQVAAKHFRRALNLARAGEAGLLIAQIWASRSHLSLHRGDIDSALVAAEQAWRHLDGSEDTAVRGRILAMLIRSHAAHGNVSACLSTLNQAEQLLSKPVAPPDSGWTSPFDLGALTSEVARSMCDLRDYTAAAEFARRTIRLRSPERMRARALASLTLSRALLGQGLVEEAAEVTTTVVPAVPMVGSVVVSSQLRSVGEGLAAHRAIPMVATALGEVEDVLA